MQPALLEAQRSAADRDQPEGRPATVAFGLLVGTALVAYVAVRIAAWRHTVLFEDTDSVGLLNQTKVWLTADPAVILRDLNPDNTPFVPVLTALLSLGGWPLDFAARMVSFLFSFVLFAGVLGLALRFDGRRAAVVALVMLACSSALVPFSFALLTEPSYVATVYAGLFLFFRQHREPRLSWAAALGVLFAVAFLNRTEGLLFLASIPLLQALHFMIERPGGYTARRLGAWAATYLVVFALISAPQVWRVSRQMGGFYFNGRQAWAILLDHPDARSREAKLWGLDYSPSRVNIEVLRLDPEVRARLSRDENPLVFVKSAVENLSLVYQAYLPRTIGLIGAALAAVGLIVLARRRRFLAAAAVLLIAQLLAAPVVQYHVLARHVLVLVPLAFVLAGVGAAALPRLLFGPYPQPVMRTAGVTAVAAGLWVMAEALPLRYALEPPTFNAEYDPATLREPVAIVRSIVAREPSRKHLVADRRAYLPYYAGVPDIRVPYTDLAGLTRYLTANEADLLFLEYSQVRGYPFLAELGAPTPPPGYTRLYRADTPTSDRLELYRFAPPLVAHAGESAGAHVGATSSGGRVVSGRLPEDQRFRGAKELGQ